MPDRGDVGAHPDAIGFRSIPGAVRAVQHLLGFGQPLLCGSQSRVRVVSLSCARLSFIAALIVCAALTPSSVALRASSESGRKMGWLVRQRANRSEGQSRVILRATDGAAA